jgi:hypothetical protein
MKYEIEHIIFLVKKYYELKDIYMVQRSFRAEYPKLGTPSHSNINNLMSNFKKHGTVAYVSPIYINREQKREKAKKDLEKLTAEFPNLSINLKKVALVEIYKNHTLCPMVSHIPKMRHTCNHPGPPEGRMKKQMTDS